MPMLLDSQQENSLLITAAICNYKFFYPWERHGISQRAVCFTAMTIHASSDLFLHTKSQRYGGINEMLDIMKLMLLLMAESHWALG